MPFDPASAAFGMAGLGLSIYGGIEGMNAAKEEANISKAEVGVEEQQDQVRRAAMELSAKRQQTQATRNMQQARSAALAANVAGGGSAMSGQANSSLAGAFGNIMGAGNTNKSGIEQNLLQGEQMFNLNQNLDALKMAMAGAQTQAATAQGIASFGSSLSGMGKLFGGG